MIAIASYPRSGNTMLRANLHRAFGLKSMSVYRDDLAGDEDLAAVVGHVEGGPAPLVKTHAMPGDLTTPAIYIVRDGRAASHSLFEFVNRGVSLSHIIQGATVFGSWSSHVAAWVRCPDVMHVRYEDAKADMRAMMTKIGDRFGFGPIADDFAPVTKAEMGSERFARRETRTTWRECWEQKHVDMFWDLHGATMCRMGYRYD
jgi:hypothetical protein